MEDFSKHRDQGHYRKAGHGVVYLKEGVDDDDVSLGKVGCHRPGVSRRHTRELRASTRLSPTIKKTRLFLVAYRWRV